MTLKTPGFLKAAGLSAALATAAAPAVAESSMQRAPIADSPGQSLLIHGWSKESQAEFTMDDVRTGFQTGEPDVLQDIHIDCNFIIVSF